MIALIQRVTRAEVRVDGEMVGAIEDGIVALIGVRRGDTESSADRLLERILSYRIFRDAQDKMNLSLQETKGGLLLISQFTLAADTQKGTRASFTPAAAPDDALRLFDRLATRARASHSPVATGKFGANMQVSLTNDGPVTFWLESSSSASARPCGNSQPTRICE